MVLNKPGYTFKLLDEGTLEVWSPGCDLLLVRSIGTAFLPVTNRAVNWSAPKVVAGKIDGVDAVAYELASNSLYQDPRVVLKLKDDYIEYYFQAKAVKRRMSLHKWYLLARGSEINALEVLDFRSHINSPWAYETHQTILARRKLGTHGLEANTEDSDLMFAPHPMQFIFSHLDTQFTIAPMSLVAGESLHIKALKGTTIIDDFHIRVGDSLYWLEEGEPLESPHFMIVHAKSSDPFQTLSAYTGFLVRDGYVKAKQPQDMADWWFSPMWCSWGDQHTRLDSVQTISTAFTAEDRRKATDNITEEMVNTVVGRIEKHGLPVRTLILDDRWYDWQGDMRVDQSKFPDMRRMVDKLHARGFKVMCWASLYQFDRESKVFTEHPDWFIVHHYPRNRNNPERDIICLDYSNPDVAAAYLGEMMTRLLSDQAGCYNLDGIKFDWPFLLPHDYAYANREWVGKEKTIHNTQKLVYQAAKAAKRDALIIGVSPHPFFNDTQDVIRTYDVSTFDIRIHTDRAKYVRAIAPGMVPAMDEHVFYQNFFRYIEEGSKLGIPMMYNLLRFNGDGVPYSEEDYRRLKVLLDDYVNRTPRLKKYLQSLKQ